MIVGIADAHEDELKELVPNALHHDLVVALNGMLEENPPESMLAAGESLEGAAACDYLLRCMSWPIAEAERAAAAASPARWLYLLRRVATRHLVGHHPTTWMVQQFTAEALSATGTMTEEVDAFPANAHAAGTHGFAISPVLLPDLCRLLACAILVNEIGVMYRWCAKGAALELTGSGVVGRAFVRVVHTPELAGAVALYDSRIGEGDTGLGWQSESGARFLGQATDSAATPLLGAFPYTGDGPITLDADYFREDLRLPPMVTQLEVRPRFRVVAIDARGVSDFLARSTGGAWPATSLVALLGCLRAAFARNSAAFLNIVRHGYVMFSAGGFDEAVRDALDDLRAIFPGMVDLSASEVIAELHAKTGSVWPLRPGPVIRTAVDAVYVDVAAATARLRDELGIPGQGGGRLPNMRGDLFEHDVQDVIADSPWSPGDSLLALRGRQLRLKGRTVTDIDAAGERDGVLLAVSVKSVPYSAEYDSGEYRLVRNLANRCEEFIRDWAARMTVLMQNPIGDNYDLSRYRTVIGVVCLPFIPFCHLGPATEHVAPGLRAVSSVAELAAWLRDGPTPEP